MSTPYPSSQFDLSLSSHRLASISALDALQTQSAQTAPISTGLRSLDALLLDGKNSQASDDGRAGGLPRRQISELYGPPGSGKTQLCIQLAANAVCNKSSVLWIDCSTKLFRPRFEQVLEGVKSTACGRSQAQMNEQPSELRHVVTTSLAHLLSIIKTPPPSLGLEKTSLIVLESLSTVVDLAYQRPHEKQGRVNDSDAAWRAGRKYAVLNDIVSTLSKIAAVHNLAVIITNQTVTRVTGMSRAVLVPSISGADWENGISTRMVVFRDWGPTRTSRHGNREDEAPRSVHIIGLLKARGERLDQAGRFGGVVPFTIHQDSVKEVDLEPSVVPLPVSPEPRRSSKRSLAGVIPDSEDEYGSDDDFDWFEDADFAALTQEPGEPQRTATQEGPTIEDEGRGGDVNCQATELGLDEGTGKTTAQD